VGSTVEVGESNIFLRFFLCYRVTESRNRDLTFLLLLRFFRDATTQCKVDSLV
jgi:hypothetical protein